MLPSTVQTDLRRKPGFWQVHPTLVAPEWRWAWESLVFAYALWEGSGKTVFDLVNRRAASLSKFNGKWKATSRGVAYNFNGDGDYFEDAAGEFLINGLTEASIVALVKSELTGTDRGICIAEAPIGQDNTLTMRYDSVGADGGGTNVIKVAFGDSTDGGASRLESSSNVQTTDLQHLIATWRANEAPDLYINGILDSPTSTSSTGSIISNTTTFRIGQGSKGSSTVS